MDRDRNQKQNKTKKTTDRQTQRQRHRKEEIDQGCQKDRHRTKLEPKIKATPAETGIRARAPGESGGGMHRGSREVEGAGELQE